MGERCGDGAGTMTNPPPTPRSPARSPDAAPISARIAVEAKVHLRRPVRGSSLQVTDARAASRCMGPRSRVSWKVFAATHVNTAAKG